MRNGPIVHLDGLQWLWYNRANREEAVARSEPSDRRNYLV